jgi:uncharacterized protein
MMNIPLRDRINSLAWPEIETTLDGQGYSPIGRVLTREECGELSALYPDEGRFRSRIDMERFRFGVGEYKYFADPLPSPVQVLREEFYERLAPVANRWLTTLGGSSPYPPSLGRFLATCHRAGQRRPTPLLLSYSTGGYNCLHQDIYGEISFPLQVVFLLSHPDQFAGGELLLVEQRPRAQSRGHAVTLQQGAGVVFATRERPVAGSRGAYRVNMRHGVSTVTSGTRMTLGIIFHDAK